MRRTNTFTLNPGKEEAAILNKWRMIVLGCTTRSIISEGRASSPDFVKRCWECPHTETQWEV